MKGMYKVVIAILLVYLPLITIAAADPVMTVSQQPVDAGLNDTFTAEVTVNPADSEIYAASYSLYFNSAILKATEQTQEDFLGQGGAETYEVVNRINNTAGRIEYGETRMGDPETVGGATTPGVLASITFEVIGEGMSTLTLSNVNYVKPEDLTDPEPDPEPAPTNDDESYRGSSHRSSGSSGHIAITTPTATSTETPTESVTPTSDDNGTIEDRDSVDVSGESGSAAAESMPAKTPTKKMPSHPTSTMPGFAAALAIMSLLAVVIILKSRGE